MRVRVAFSADEASAMLDATWAALGDAGITRSDLSTWTRERPEHLQQLKAPPAFSGDWQLAIIAGCFGMSHPLQVATWRLGSNLCCRQTGRLGAEPDAGGDLWSGVCRNLL